MYRIIGINRHVRRYLFNSSIYRVESKTQQEVKKQDNENAKLETPSTEFSTPSTPISESSVDLTEKKFLKKQLSPTLPETSKVTLPPRSLVDADIKTIDVAEKQELELKMVTSFDEMPGPKILKYLAHGWSYFPRIGNQFTAAAMVYFMNILGASLVWNRGIAPFKHMFDKYGPVVRLQGVFGGDIVFVQKPEHIETVYQEEGEFPVRSALDSLEIYRDNHRKRGVAGPFISFGPDWKYMRSKLENPFLELVTEYAPQLETVADDFMENLKTILNQQEETPDDFDEEIFKWAVESVSLVCFGRRLHLVGDQSVQPDSMGSAMFDAMQTASNALRKCESGFQVWRLVKTPGWSNLVSGCELIDSIILKFIRDIETRFRMKRFDRDNEDISIVKFSQDKASDDDSRISVQNQPVPLIESLLIDGMCKEDVLTVVLDMLLLGSNAMAHALSFLLYRMAKSPRAQRTAYEELYNLMPEPTSQVSSLIKAGRLENLTYLKACLRESLRMSPPIPVLTRILPRDIVIHNYHIPKGTMVLMATHVAGMKEENFEDCKKFKPERWLTPEAHPFASLPYGHGPRCCVARQLADVQILFLAAKIFRSYSIEYNYGIMHPTNRLIAMPNRPLKFGFTERS